MDSRYYQELAPAVAMDRAESAVMVLTIDTSAGQFVHCVKVIETSPLESGKGIKIYTPGIGLIQDEDLLLVNYGFVNE